MASCEIETSSHMLADDDEEDGFFAVQRARHKRRAVIEDDDDDENENDNDDERPTETSSIIPTSASPTAELETSIDDTACEAASDSTLKELVDSAQGSCEEVTGLPERNTTAETSGLSAHQMDGSCRMNFASDIFDAEISDDDSRPARKQTSSEDEGVDYENTNDDDEGLSSEILAKLKKMKGASKSAKERKKYERKAKPKAEEMLEIYSESQRLLRDSRVNLPYYEPQPKQLDDFLARAMAKKKEYAGLKKAKDIQKAQIISEKLSLTPPVTQVSAKRNSLRHRTAGSQMDKCGQVLAGPELDAAQLSLATSVVGNLVQSPTDSEVGYTIQSLADPKEDSVQFSSHDLEKLHSDTHPHTRENSAVSLDDENSANVDLRAGLLLDTLQTAPAVPEMNAQQLTIEVPAPSLHRDPSRDLFLPEGSQASQKEQAHAPSLCQSDQIGSCSPQPNVRSKVRQEVSVNEMETDSDNNIEIPQPVIKDALDCVLRLEATEDFDQDISSTLGNRATLERSIDITSDTVKCVGNGSATHTETAVSPLSVSSTLVSNPSKPVSKLRKSLLEKLQDLNLPESPSLSGTQNDTICFDDTDCSPVVIKPGLLKLMDRLVQHSSKKPTPPTNNGTPGDLLEEKVTSDNGAEEADTGFGLGKLKQKLDAGMRKRRAEARQRRLQLYALENEEGFEKGENGEDEEKEESFDCSDEDSSESEMENNDDENSEDDEEGDEILEKLKNAGDDSDDEDFNPFMDTEAREDDSDDGDEDDDDDEDGDVHLHFDVSEDEDGSNSGEENDVDDFDAKPDSFLENDQDGSCDNEVTLKRKKKRNSRPLTSDDEAEEPLKEAAAASPGDTTDKIGSADAVVNFNDESSELELALDKCPAREQQEIEDTDNLQSQDLYSQGAGEDQLSSISHQTDKSVTSQHTQQSNLLDADGYIKFTQTQPKSRLSMLIQNPSTEDSMDCNKAFGQIFHHMASQAVGSGQGQTDTQDENMKELLGLCSGTFGSVPESPAESITQQFSVQSSKYNDNDGNDDDDGDVFDPFHVLSDSDSQDSGDRKGLKQKKSVLSDSEEAEESDDETAELDNNEEDDHFTELKKKKFDRRNFFDEEAELSGSEYDSDENLDLAEEDDILEEEAGDRDLQGVSEEKLRGQVGKLHTKQLQDDDDRAVMRYKEMFLQDGDLYTDGAGRKRNFRWKDVDYDMEDNARDQNSDNEQAEDDLEDANWRISRFEREKFLQGMNCETKEEDSQVLKLGQVFLKRQESITCTKNQISMNVKVEATVTKPGQTTVTSGIQRKGSFLSRGVEVLAKIGKAVKVGGEGGASGKHSRNFVFQTIDEPEDDGKDKEEKTDSVPAGKRKAHSLQQPPKKQKTAASNQALNAGTDPKPKPATDRQTSIFNLFKEL